MTEENHAHQYLEEVHRLYPKGKLSYNVCIDEIQITLEPLPSDGKEQAGKKVILKVDDVVGSSTMKGKESGDVKSYLTIFSYPRKKKMMSKDMVRKRHTVTLIFDEHPTYDLNLQHSTLWNRLINGLARKVVVPHDQDLRSLNLPARKKLLILVNPCSGPGKALQIFQQRIIPILAEAGVTYHLIITEHAGHASEMMMTLELSDWYGVVIVSGDGLLHEVVNGLMGREDWEEAIKLPLGVLPGGSGNALSCALLHRLGEACLDSDNLIRASAYMLAKHDILPMDLVAIDTCKGKRLYSFLAVAWGMISDVDIESEKFRGMGESRFTLMAAVKILGLKKYRGRISFLPVDKDYKPPEKHRSSLKRSQSACTPSQPQENLHRSQSTDQSTVAQGTVGAEPTPDTVRDKDPHTEGLVRADADQAQAGDVAVNGQSNGSIQPRTAGDGQSQPTTHAVPCPLLNPLDQPVPDNWVTIEDDFIFASAVYLTHLGKGMIAAAESQLDDNTIYMAICRGDVSRLQVLGMFNDMETGKVSESQHMEHVAVKAFRIEPLTESGILTVDGERVDYGPIQGQMLPNMSRILTPKQLTS